MRISILAARDDAAQKRITVAATALAERFDLPGCLTALQQAQSKDPAVEAMQQREAVAELLEALVIATEPKTKRTKKDDTAPAEPKPELPKVTAVVAGKAAETKHT